MAPGRFDIALLRKVMRSGSSAKIHRLLEKLGPSELALLLSELPPGELKVVIEHIIDDRRLTTTFQAVPDELLSDIANSVGEKLLSRIVNAMDADDATRIAQLLGDAHRTRVLAMTDPDLGDKINRLLLYPPESAGSRMIPGFVSVRRSATVGDGIRAIRQASDDVPLFYLYVTDNGGDLVGVMSLAQLVKAPDKTPVSEIMATDVVSVSVEADQEEVARTVSRRNLLAVPVVEDGRLVGLVTIDDVIDVLEQEATEDMYNMAGLSEGDRVFSPPARSLAKRLPWNALNLLTSLAAAAVVSAFEGTIDKLVVLATFMPLVAGIGGNTGNQTLTVIIRGITLGELEFSSAIRAIFKELLVGLCIGVVLGSVVALVAVLWKGSMMLGVVIALAMIANLLVAAFVGTAIPLTLKRLGLDPALGGSILVTMCTDIFGFFAFLGLATLFMRHLV